jgi:prepilin-type N-terminal cleavage/methylation domain-containing protein
MTGRRGFTLIEVIIVVAIVAISLGMAGPRIGAGFGRLELFRAEGIVRNMAKFGRLEAQRSDKGHYMVLDQGRNSVVLVDSDLNILREESLPSSVRFELDPAVSAASIYIAPSGIFRGAPVRLLGRNGETEVMLR